LAGSYPAIAVIGITIAAAKAATKTPNFAKDLSFIEPPKDTKIKFNKWSFQMTQNDY
jgi:hypothetical protein